MRQYIRQRRFEITFDQDFAGVLAGCAEKELNGVENWVTPDIQAAYRTLREWGVAHSVEAWQDGKLVGGVLGVGIGSFFSSDTVFFRVSHASKVAFAHLLAALRKSGYTLHDVQSTGPFNQEFGSYEIPAGEYRTQLARAVVRPATLRPIPVEDIAPVAKPQARPIAV
jgi:leucyl/phenylalanyl-tRNA--protein transferase